MTKSTGSNYLIWFYYILSNCDHRSEPGLNIEVDGHTDNVGSDEYNQNLSDQRAESVRAYLVAQGVLTGSATAKGFGKTQPVGTNDTAAGRQINRRVELVVSGEAIGAQAGGAVGGSL